MGSEWGISEDLIGITGNVLGFMRVKSRHLESVDTISALNKEFVFNTTASKESRDDPLSHQTTRSFSQALLLGYRFGGSGEITE